jgi:sugar lactone lactonase YvrE
MDGRIGAHRPPFAAGPRQSAVRANPELPQSVAGANMASPIRGHAMRLLRLLPLAFALASLPALAATDDWRTLNRQAAAQAKAGDDAGLHATLVRLAPALPGSATVAYHLAASAAKLGHPDEAVATLTRLADAGLAYDLARDDDFTSLVERADFQAVRERLRANKGPVGTPLRVMAFDTADWLPESLAWDAGTKRLFVSDVRHCQVRVIADPSRTGTRAAASARASRAFARLPASVFALGLDAKHRRLWATIATVSQADHCGEGAPSDERTALLALDARTGRVLQRIDAGAAGVKGVLGDLLVAGDGTVFASESLHGAVLRLRPGARAFERLDVAGDFASPQQPALSPDGRTLIVPDYVRGIGLIDLAAPAPSAARWPANGAGVFTAGIDGLVRDGASLLAVQNGLSPARVIRFSDDLQRQQVLESGTPGLGEPTHAIVVGRQAWFVADVGWDRFADAGPRKPAAPPSHAELRAIPLDPDALAVNSGAP